MEREDYTCPVTLLKDKTGPKSGDKNELRARLQAAHILPFSLGGTPVRDGSVGLQETMWLIDLVPESGLGLHPNVHWQR